MPRSSQSAALASLASLAVLGGAAAYGLAGTAQLVAGNIGFTLAAVAAVAGTLRAARSPHGGGGWRLLAAATACWLVGQLAWDWYAFAGGGTSPSLADAGWLAFAPLAAAGATRLIDPAADDRRLSVIEAVVLTAAVTGGVLAMLAEDVSATALTPGAATTVLAYPAAYVSGLIVVVQAAMRARRATWRDPALALLAAGLAAQAAAFILWLPPLLDGTYAVGEGPIDAIWIIGLLAIAAGGWTAGGRAAHACRQAKKEPLSGVLPGLAFVFVLAVLVYQSVSGAGLALRLGLDLALFLVGGLLLVRFALLQRAGRRAVADARAAQEELDRFFTLSHDLFCVATARGGRVLRVNPAFGRALGRADAELLGRALPELVHQDDAGRMQAALAAVAGGAPALDVETRCRGEAGDRRWLHWHGTPLRERGLVYLIARDVTAEKASAATLARMAYTDALTGLLNRASFGERLEAAVADARAGRAAAAVLFVDLDDFKRVNDTAGHHAGDELLRGVAARLAAATRAGDVVARQGGDEFLVLVTGRDAADTATVASALADRLRAALAAPFPLAGGEVAVAASIGISTFPHDGDTAERLLATADAAMYGAKRAGRGMARMRLAG